MRHSRNSDIKIRRILAPNTTNESANGKIEALNWLIRGWCEYYRSTSSPSIYFTKVSNEIYWHMAHWLGRKYKLSYQKYAKVQKGITFGTKTRTLARPDEFKAKRYIAKTWHNPYTEKEKSQRKGPYRTRKPILYDRLGLGEDRKGWMDLREEVILLRRYNMYQLQGTFHPSEVQVDHILPRKRFKDPTDADRMKNLQLLCTYATELRPRLIGKC